ncbi:MAG TPA: DUF3667 domain-containing protein [Chryseosolibacter sp.]
MSHKKYREEKNCLNCGAEVLGKFCQNCGQENIEQRDSFVHMVGHFISDYLHFDSKFFRSLIPLLVKPGFLTKQYWEGKRTHYIPPLRLFFFVTILFVLVTSFFYNRFGQRLKDSIVNIDPVAMSEEAERVATMPDTAKIFVKKWNKTVTAAELREELEDEKRRFGKIQIGFDNVFKNLKYVMFFLLPVYALVFKLLFIRRRSYYIDHLIYAMHLQTFAYILLAIVLFLPFLFELDFQTMRSIAFFSILAYIAVSLHYLYRQQIWKTALKSFLATVTLFFITMLTIMLTAVFEGITM